MKKKILLNLGLVLCCTGTINASHVSTFLQNQLNTNRAAFEANLTAALSENSIVPLSQIPVPMPEFDVALSGGVPLSFIKNDEKLLQLGKALYWDIQVGDDTRTACATCHNGGGSDQRTQNQISFAHSLSTQNGTLIPDIGFEDDKPSSPVFGPNIQLSVEDFPRNKKADKRDVFSSFIRETNTVLGSAGVHFKSRLNNGQRDGFDPIGSLFESVPLDPTDFKMPFANTGREINTRRVGGRNAPTAINAVFNHRQFWNGVASNIFNGVTPFGTDDTRAGVFRRTLQGDLAQVLVRFKNASLASQAVGPPSNPSEMTIGESIGNIQGHNEFIKGINRRKLLDRRPLARQHVDPTDSVLGSLARPGKGLNVRNYRTMIQEAFRDEWWNVTDRKIRLNSDNAGSREVVAAEYVDPNGEPVFSQMETNFSLFFGLALNRYEATLVSDDTPVDRYLSGDHSALNDSELIGFRIAAKEARCLNCHGGAEFTYASVSRIEEQGLVRNRRGDLIDEGFNNIGVTPTLDDLGVGGLSPSVQFGDHYILSEARKAIGNFPNLHLASDGAFKIPTLRNVELTAPYFHNGSESTLEDVMDFYFRGGNYRTQHRSDDHNHPIIGYNADRTEESEITGLGILSGPHKDSNVGENNSTVNPGGLDDEDRAHLVDFLKALTDERVRYNRAPFDHPELPIPEGHFGDDSVITRKSRDVARDHWSTLPAVGAAGTSAPFETFNDKLLAP